MHYWKTVSNKTLFCNRLECPHVWVRYHKLKSMLNSNSAFLVSLHLFMSTKQKYVINKDSIDAIYFLFQLPWIELLISNSSNCKMCLGNVYVIFILFLIKNYYSGEIFDVITFVHWNMAKHYMRSESIINEMNIVNALKDF